GAEREDLAVVLRALANRHHPGVADRLVQPCKVVQRSHRVHRAQRDHRLGAQADRRRRGLDGQCQPADLADVVTSFAPGDARWITGHLLDANGGMFLGPHSFRRSTSTRAASSGMDTEKATTQILADRSSEAAVRNGWTMRIPGM